MTTRARRHVTTVVVATALLGLGAACSDDDGSEATCGTPETAACYSPADVQAHCYLVQLRDQYAGGRFTVDQLPPRADRTMRDGAPLIIDLSEGGWPGLSPAQTVDSLEQWRSQRGLTPVDSDRRSSCRGDTDNTDMVDLYGEPQG